MVVLTYIACDDPVGVLANSITESALTLDRPAYGGIDSWQWAGNFDLSTTLCASLVSGQVTESVRKTK